MTLIHRKKSVIFNLPSSLTQKSSLFKIQVHSIINHHKEKLSLNHRSIEIQKQATIQKLSLHQAKKIEKLFQKLSENPRPCSALTKSSNSNYNTIIQPASIRKKSLHLLLEGYQKNVSNINQEEKNRINPQRFQLFRKGKYYRSKERASGAGVCKASKKSLVAYYKFDDQSDMQICSDVFPLQKSVSRRPKSSIDHWEKYHSISLAPNKKEIRKSQNNQIYKNNQEKKDIFEIQSSSIRNE